MPENPYAPPRAISRDMEPRIVDQTRRPVWHGVVAAPWAPSTLLFAYAMSTDGPTGLSELLFWAFATYGVGVPVGYCVMAGLGLPYILWLQRRGYMSWLTICIGSAVIGTLCALPFWFLGFKGPLLLSGLVGGLAAGITFCAVVRPNNSFKPKPLRGSA